MIALDEVRADLKLAAAWCDIVDPSVRGADFYGQVYLLSSGRTTVTPMVELSRRYRHAATVNRIARACLDLVGYPPVTYASHPPRIKATMVKVGPRSHHDHAAALHFFNAFGMAP
ncbi:hypothetical protein ACSQ76_06545 [Roseovarius sp. B08]|uniref:hypothetical protein n=1 Tax=Roseovarius sp. B08 TaxID=3449223 RepID=UPI003EDB933B